jgi:glycosyltransferase involved in cell wall biosynthesis
VLLTGSPFHPFLISIFVKGLLGIPTFLDFRDAWSLNNGFDGRRVKYFKERFRRYLLILFERIAIKFASGVIFATDTLQKEYRRLLPFQQKKFYTVTNGYDAEDFISVKPIRTVKKKAIILVGQFNLYTPEVLLGLLQALKLFPFLHFIYIGSENHIINQKARLFGSQKQVTTLPYLPHRELINHIAGADYGLVTSGLPNILGTKIFDYLALKKPILCFVPTGSEIARNFVKEKSIVICESPHTLESIKNGLNLLLEVKECTTEKILDRFSRKETTKKLAQILQMGSTNQ